MNLHINYLESLDASFRTAWRQHRDVCGPRLQALDQFHREMQSGSVNLKVAHQIAARATLQVLAKLPNYDFRTTPASAQWISFAKSTHRTGAFCQHARFNITRLVSELGPFTCYGGLKNKADVELGLRRARRLGTVPDLWDAVRFRVVCHHVPQLESIARQFLCQFRGRVVRCRNYYLDPRNGVHDPYRAVHLELQYDNEEFVEIQLLTANREAIGQIDHSLVRKKSILPIDSQHARWIREISWTANLVDSLPFRTCTR